MAPRIVVVGLGPGGHDHVTDETRQATDWFRNATRRFASDRPLPLSLIDLMGDRFPSMAANLLKNLEEDRAAVVRGILVLTM